MDYRNFSYEEQHGSSRSGLFSILSHICRLVTTITSILSHTLALLVLVCFITLLVLINEVSELDSDKAAEMIAAQNLTTPPSAYEKTPVLYFDLQGSVCEYPFSTSQMQTLARLLDERLTGRVSHTIFDLEQALEYAAQDSDLKEIVFNLDGLEQLSLSNAERIGAALDKLKAQDPKKQITMLSTAYSTTAYALAAHADKVLLDPMGGVNLTGIGINNLYYRDLFKRFKLEPYVFRAGAYKAAVEPYLRSDMSEEVRTELRGIATELWDNYTAALKTRKALAGQTAVLPDSWTYLSKLRAQKGMQAKLDLSEGLVDELKPLNEVRAAYAKQYGTLTDDTLEPKVTDYRDYLKYENHPKVSSSSKIALIFGLGEITSREESPLNFTPNNLLPLLEQICLDREIKAVVVYLNSPGGEVEASEQIRRALQEVRDHGKKVIVAMHGTAASGAYLIATASDYIFATPNTLTGSIGVFALSLGVDGLLNEYGVQEDGVATHEFAEAYLGRPLPAQLKAIYQTGVEGIYQVFIDTVSKSRKLKAEDYLNFAEGRVFLARQAQQLGLIDQVGSLNEALDKACELSSLKREEVEVVKLLPEENNSLNLLQSLILRASIRTLPLSMVKAELDYFTGLERVSTPQGERPKVMALSPWQADFSHQH
ncbi:MAG: signal peptide peptidase SppA [Succinivibrio sp.]|nr:signal peptide peptidase SppA [Succinivibrio sp.]